MNAPTLIEHIQGNQATVPGATGELSRILARLSLAGRMIAQRILNAGFLGEHGETGSVNVQGEEVQKLDELADEIFLRVFETLGSVAGLASEEVEDITVFAREPGEGKYIVMFDPLDGSGNIPINGSLGSIFSVHAVDEGVTSVDLAQFLKPGRQQVAAGYILYGPATVFVYAAGESPVSAFTLDRSIGEFFLTHADLMIPSEGGSYSCNESNEPKWDARVKELIRSYRVGEAKVGSRSARYTGALVADFHRTLLKGGVFLYPGQISRPRGKLRYLYEAAPLAMIAERAGGAASDGQVPILDLEPKALHERCPLYIGTKADVEYVNACLAD